jgi:hypothetical protein
MSESDFYDFIQYYNYGQTLVKMFQETGFSCLIGMNENRNHFLIDSLGLS